MKILFFIESLHSGGKERRLVELIKGISKDSNYELGIVLTRNNIHYKDIFSTKTDIYYAVRKQGLKKDPSVFYKFYNISKRFKPDIIHVWSNLTAIYALPSKLFLKIPMINNQITNSTKQTGYSILSYRVTFPFSDKIISNTYAGLKAYHAPKNKSMVIYNGFDFSRVGNLESAKSVRDKLGICTKYVVAMIASFSEKKDYKTFIKAANHILEERNDISFLCVGAGDFEVFKTSVRKNNLDKILFLGKQLKVESIMNVCDIGVLLTHGKHGEGISNAILEFCALKKPVIATSGGGTSEILKNGLSGYLIKEHSEKELADKIYYLIDNQDIRLEMGENANKVVLRKFTINKMINSFNSVYKEFQKKR